LIVNPVAGAGRTGKKLPQILSLLKSIGLRFEHELTEAPGHARELAKLAAKKGHELVVSIGGDGTINEVVNGLYEADSITNVTLGIISTGTGHDYIRTIGIPRSYPKACQILMNPKRRTVDVGVVEFKNGNQIDRRLFVNLAGIGFDAEMVKATTQKVKALRSTASYLTGLLRTLLSYRNKGVSIAIDGEAQDAKVCTVLMCNGKYGGGGMFPAPEADLNDGLLDVLVIGDLSKPDLLWSLPRVYKGTHLTHPKVQLKKAREIEIRSNEPLALQADGELLGELPARFYVMPATLNIIV